MRTKSSTQGYLDFTAASSSKIVAAYRRKYASISQVLEANPRLLTRVHTDLVGTVSLSEGGRCIRRIRRCCGTVSGPWRG